MRILFWGTPDFATPPLRALLGEGFDVVGVVTQPDRPRGRSRSQLDPSPVKRVAVAEGIPVLQPERPRGDAFLEEVRALAPDLSVVVAYGHILPKAVIDLPPQGTLNIHASLLPLLRGADPIRAAIRQGFATTGVAIMRMVPALDAGPVLHVLETPIADDETFGELTERLSELGALALIEALTLMAGGRATETPQDDARATYAPKTERAHARLDWTRPAEDVARAIRAYDPRPGAFGVLRGADVKLFGARPIPVEERPDVTPGEVIALGPDGMDVKCGEDAVRVAYAQPAGKARLPVADWARGRGVELGDVFAAADLGA
ncbi:methionyl-tRNA formyltransferase [Roseisolibacter sp. H3M3-2]|uniref:methionyl-tRNA formyltransferase n=1 Tax=Roseisolibacter sp. H3M3-2 TaxID=3031323 RepID=UPI0023DACECE|nr:methionyl-tRNA formyltransferase [Roseisolibacter sp. H3M3-2]MDF1504241.1 methionyl-tRNA formyltransferase [Roseisolibacter sp. H3M3-2]